MHTTTFITDKLYIVLLVSVTVLLTYVYMYTCTCFFVVIVVFIVKFTVVHRAFINNNILTLFNLSRFTNTEIQAFCGGGGGGGGGVSLCSVCVYVFYFCFRLFFHLDITALVDLA